MVDKFLAKRKTDEIGSYIRELEGVMKFREREILEDYIKLRA